MEALNPIQAVIHGGALGLLALVLFVGGPRILSAFERTSAQFAAALARANRTNRRTARMVATLAQDVRQLAGEVRDLRAALSGRVNEPPTPEL